MLNPALILSVLGKKAIKSSEIIATAQVPVQWAIINARADSGRAKTRTVEMPGDMAKSRGFDDNPLFASSRPP